ncbi:MAG: polysaccharide deacetylase family protein [Solirubrobacterales bacterium]|nr:polysaccharide deacetylase family protein [Solirubrobacterales bacterium]
MPTLALTFDDGPDRRTTPRLLDILAGAGARATFFVMADRAAASPELMARMTDEGHAVGLHCLEHVRHRDRDVAWVRSDTARALDALAALGLRPRLWRTPWGDRAPWTAALADEHRLALVGWTVDTHDWRGDSADAMFAATRAGLRAGAIVLAHDGIGPGARRDDAEQTLGFTGRVIDHAERHGLRLGALE